MLERQVEIVNKKGLHARAAAKFINLANGFESEIMVARGEDEVNGKSIMGLLMLAANKGTMITLRASGGDEDQAIDKISRLIESKFEESE
jgi:phosphocarrier protein